MSVGPPAHELAGRPPGLLCVPSFVPEDHELTRWVQRFLLCPDLWRAMHPARRRVFLEWIAHCEHITVFRGKATLAEQHREFTTDLAMRMDKPFDLQAALDDPARGAGPGAATPAWGSLQSPVLQLAGGGTA